MPTELVAPFKERAAGSKKMLEREGSIMSLENVICNRSGEAEITPPPMKLLHFGSQVYGVQRGSHKRHQSLNSWHFHNAPTVLKREFSLKRTE